MRTPTNERLSSDIAEAGAARESGSARSCPERRCILSGVVAPRDALVRLAISPDGDVLPDPLARAPGRGAWLGVTRGELEAAIGADGRGGRLRGALARAFKGAPLRVPDDLADRIEQALTKTFLDRLGLEMRAGHLILGSDRIAEQARGGALELLLHAADARDDGTRKLDQAWRVGRDAEGTGERGICLPLDRTALSVALGRENVVHLALADRKAALRVLAALQRLLHFLEAEGGLANDGRPDDRQAAVPGDGSGAGDELKIEG